MKLVFALAFIGCVAVSLGLTEEEITKLKQIKQDCLDESGADETVVNKTKEGVFAEDAKLKDFYLCFFKKPGFINDAGEYQVEVMKTKFTEKYGVEMAEKLVTDCTKANQGDAPENAINLAKCYYEHIRNKH